MLDIWVDAHTGLANSPGLRVHEATPAGTVQGTAFRSRNHRLVRALVSPVRIALIVNSEGFSFSYETFDGNRADVSTMETILPMVERKHGKARRIWVLDRGIVSEQNLQAIRKRGGQYLVGTPRSQMKQLEQELLKDDWTKVRPDVEVKKVPIAQGEETYILCRTAGRKEKEKAIRSRFSRPHGKCVKAPDENHSDRAAKRIATKWSGGWGASRPAIRK